MKKDRKHSKADEEEKKSWGGSKGRGKGKDLEEEKKPTGKKMKQSPEKPKWMEKSSDWKKSATLEEEKASKPKKDLAKPKKCPGEYAVFTKLFGEEIMKGKEGVDITDRSKSIAEAYKVITDK